MKKSRGYTLVELVVAVGFFAIIMTFVSGAYIMMFGLIQRTQGIATGMDNLSFALETMTRSTRTGTGYSCGGAGDCPNGMNNFSFTNAGGIPVSYNLSGATIQQTVNGVSSILTDPMVAISSLMFYVSGTVSCDAYQPHVTIVASGTVSPGAGKPSQSFAVETGATMRGSDLGLGSACTPIAGGWSDWSGWSSCSVSCGGGTQTATQTCTAPPPSGGGANCVGSGSRSQSCNTQVCPMSATGGTITYTDSSGFNPRSSPSYPGGYTVHTFTTDGTFTVTGSGNVNVLVIAGGGGGGDSVALSGRGGGGGAGGYIYNASSAVTSGSYYVGIGGGGSNNANGSDSSFNGIAATGGGKGGRQDADNTAHVGGSGGSGGGGGARYDSGNFAGGSGISGQGYAGGIGGTDNNTYRNGGGGGGAGQVGHDAAYMNTPGGDGLTNSISGISTYYAGGGGGTADAGGQGGGGSGNGGSGTANTGGGGGGTGGTIGGSGGSGVVIIRYPTP